MLPIKLIKYRSGIFIFLFLMTTNILLYVCLAICIMAWNNLSIGVGAVWGHWAARAGRYMEPTSSVLSSVQLTLLLRFCCLLQIFDHSFWTTSIYPSKKISSWPIDGNTRHMVLATGLFSSLCVWAFHWSYLPSNFLLVFSWCKPTPSLCGEFGRFFPGEDGC